MYRSPLGMMIRPADKWASDGGGWQAARSRDGRPRKHEGIDLCTIVGQPIVAPGACLFLRVADPYVDSKDGILLGVLIVMEDGVKLKMLYLDPILEKVGKKIQAGEIIGHAQSLQHLYPGARDHIHVEAYASDGVRIDPRPYFGLPVTA